MVNVQKHDGEPGSAQGGQMPAEGKERGNEPFPCAFSEHFTFESAFAGKLHQGIMPNSVEFGFGFQVPFQ